MHAHSMSASPFHQPRAPRCATNMLCCKFATTCSTLLVNGVRSRSPRACAGVPRHGDPASKCSKTQYFYQPVFKTVRSRVEVEEREFSEAAGAPRQAVLTTQLFGNLTFALECMPLTAEPKLQWHPGTSEQECEQASATPTLQNWSWAAAMHHTQACLVMGVKVNEGRLAQHTTTGFCNEITVD